MARVDHRPRRAQRLDVRLKRAGLPEVRKHPEQTGPGRHTSKRARIQPDLTGGKQQVKMSAAADIARYADQEKGLRGNPEIPLNVGPG